MKRSELKEYIKEIILAELEENEAYNIVGKTGKIAVQSFPNSTSANSFKSNNINVASIEKLEETEDEEPTQADIQKEKSLTKAQTEWAKITKELKSNVSKIKDIISKKPADRTKADEDLLTKMKELTKRKNQLKSKFSELDDEN
jgi:hypothetical protein